MATKNQLVREVADATGTTQREAKAVVEAFLARIVDCVADGEDVKLSSFGTFRSVVMAEQTFSPVTGDEDIHLPERRGMRFSVGPTLKRGLARQPLNGHGHPDEP